MMLPPNTWTIAWKPRHTPKIGIFPANFSISSKEIPASLGVHGPGDMTMWLGFKVSISLIEISSLR